MQKNKKYISKRGQTQPGRGLVPFLIIAGGAVLIILTLIFALQPQSTLAAQQVTGTPRLKTDQEKIDLGDVSLGTTVQATFQLTNIGDQALRFTRAPFVELKEGC